MMTLGMMWFDNDPKKTLEQKVDQAADYYLRKYGVRANRCMVNPRNLPAADSQTGAGRAGRVEILPLRSVMPGHLWIGRDETPTAGD